MFGLAAFAVPGPGVDEAVRVFGSDGAAQRVVAVDGGQAQRAGLFDEIACGVVVAAGDVAQGVGLGGDAPLCVMGSAALRFLRGLARLQPDGGALRADAPLRVSRVGGFGAVRGGLAGQLEGAACQGVAVAGGAPQGVGEAEQAAFWGVVQVADAAAGLGEAGQLACAAVAVEGVQAAGLTLFGDVAAGVVGGAALPPKRVGFTGDVAVGVVFALRGAAQRVGDGSFVVVGVVLVAGDAA